MTFENRIHDVDRLKKEIDAYRPLSAHALQQFKEYFRIGLTYTSNALEGNSLTESETKRDHFEAVSPRPYRHLN